MSALLQERSLPYPISVQLSPAFISFIIIHLLINIHGSANGYGYNWGK